MYQLRHTFATTLVSSNKLTMNEVAKILGHNSLQMLVRHYNKFLPNKIEKIDTSFDPFCNGFYNGTTKSA
jgi:integrase